MSEIVERVAVAIDRASERYGVTSRRSDGGDEWFVVDESLPCGEFAAGPFEKMWQAVAEEAKIIARAAIEAMREPTQRMAGLAVWEAMHIDESKLALYYWKAFIDEALK